ncbi:hypothetical protein CRG98_022286 [Punica granatum]|uniref:DUF4283 domain-containing protein n=1 Tax=Punica granatum TaxID=22663 RepID=A0A2I0JM40_PUNGR|nr:hypothetical protein CRG98_022286 [Punica granatum]
MDHCDLENSLADMFGTQMTMAHAQEILNLPTNEEEESIETIPLTFLLKPFGFKPPPPKAIIPRLLQAWNIRKWVTITPKKYIDDILGKSLEEIHFNSVAFWVQLRGIPPEMLSKKNITSLAERAGQVIDIDWKDSPSLPKWLTPSTGHRHLAGKPDIVPLAALRQSPTGLRPTLPTLPPKHDFPKSNARR